jgi:quercetin dioxygenase-like cupin family protein
MHSHPDAVAIFPTDGHVKFTYPGGKTEEREMKAGQTLFTAAVKHLPENLSDGDMEVILVELKTAKRRPAPKKAAITNTNTNGNWAALGAAFGAPFSKIYGRRLMR